MEKSSSLKVKWTCSRLFVIGSLGVLRDFLGTSPVALVVKNLPASVGEVRDVGSILGSGKCPGVGNGNPLPSSGLENPLDRGVWWAAIHGVAKSQDTTEET